jgi:hypothetical protein
MLIRRTLGKRLLKKETPPMNREQELSAIAKRYGVEAIAKKVVTEGAGGISEFEMTKLIQEAGSRAYPDLKPAVAFAKIYEGDALLRHAVAACKTFQVTAGAPTHVAGGGTALAELKAKADALRKRDSSLTEAQAFLRVYEDVSNIDIVKRERAENRPHA